MKKYRITIDVDVNKDGKFVSDLNHAMYQGLRPLLIDALGAWLDGYKFKVEPFE